MGSDSSLKSRLLFNLRSAIIIIINDSVAIQCHDYTYMRLTLLTVLNPI